MEGKKSGQPSTKMEGRKIGRHLTFICSLAIVFLIAFSLVPINALSAAIADIKILDQQYVPIRNMGDFSYNGTHFWVPDAGSNRIVVYDWQLNVIEEHTFSEFLINTRMACTFNETHLFLGSGGTNTIYAINLQTWGVTTLPEALSFDEVGALICLEHLDGKLYATYLSDSTNVVRVLSAITGELLHKFASGLKRPYGVAADENGSLWLTDYESSMIIQVDPKSENIDFVVPDYIRRYYTPNYPELPRAIAYDGNSLWIVAGSILYRCNPRVGIYPEPEGFPFHIFFPVVTIGIISLGFITFLTFLRDPKDFIEHLAALTYRLRRKSKTDNRN
ncbi:MAG: hypothetical protein ACFFBD_05050 [Candidatus Hodarchaeota archaeon]